MSKTKFTEQQMIDAIERLEAGRRAKGLARELAITGQTLYHWRAKNSGLDVNEAQRLSLACGTGHAMKGAG
jgi:putative transposase